jgi:hypothetical protein
MDRNRDHEIELADDAVEPIRVDYLPGEELVEAVERGEVSHQEANEELQAAARRHTAEHGPDLDTDEEGQISESGFGSGRGMAKHSTGGRKAREGIENN